MSVPFIARGVETVLIASVAVVMHADDALVETYQDFPPWGLHRGWNEVVDAAGSLTPVQVRTQGKACFLARERRLSCSETLSLVQVVLIPGFSDRECAEALHLYAPELTERCIHGKRQVRP